MRIRFLSEQVYQSGAADKWPHFDKGEVIDEAGIVAKLGLKSEPSDDWKASFLNRWLQRGVAVDDEAVRVDPQEPGVPAEPQVQAIDLTALTRAELDELATQRGVDISEAKNKADVIAALELAEELAGHND